jgi:imidazolonepropionase-like amidohydrolase
MHRPMQLAIVCLALASAAMMQRQPPAAKITAFLGARLVDGSGRAWDEDAAFVVEGTRFTQVGLRRTLKIPRGATRVNLAGKTVIPALVDALTRVTGRREDILEHLRRRTDYGVGAIVAVSPAVDARPFQLADDVAPRVARLVTAGGLAADAPSAAQFRSVPEAVRAVQELAEKKIGLVAVPFDDPAGSSTMLPAEVSAAIISEAHSRGMRVMGRIRTLQGAKTALQAGVDILAGVPRDTMLDQEILALFQKRRDVSIVSNLSDPGIARDVGWLAKSVGADELTRVQSAPVQPDAKETFTVQSNNLGRLVFEGLQVALGSDSETPWGHLLEMEDMGRSVPAFAVVLAATSRAAHAAGLKEHGAIAPGSVADFLVFDGNPALDIRQLANINSVYLHGARTSPAVPPSPR